MKPRTMILLIAIACVINTSQGESDLARHARRKLLERLLVAERNYHEPEVQPRLTPPIDFSTMRLAVGSYTTLSGFFDWQTNVGAPQHIVVDPSDPTGQKIHVVMMSADDSTAPLGPTRGSIYAFSSNGGISWNNFGNLRVPARRSGYPSIGILQGSTPGVIIANQNDPGSGTLASLVYVDSPPGGGAFAGLSPIPPLPGVNQPIFPYVAGASDGSIVVGGAFFQVSFHVSRTSDYISWSPWLGFDSLSTSGAQTKSSTTGRVGFILNTTDRGVFLLESTNNGTTWPARPQEVTGNSRILNGTEYFVWRGSDVTYDGNAPLLVFSETTFEDPPMSDSAQVVFWSQATGFVIIASQRNTPNVAPNSNRPSLTHTSIDMPSIGISGNAIVVAFQAMMNNDTSSHGYRNCDIFLVKSTDGGFTWSAPRNITNTTGLDERFVSVSPWNEPGNVNLVWQEDPEAGINAFQLDPDSPVARVRVVFLKESIVTDVENERAIGTTFRLMQNYPNPFNPSTIIQFQVASFGFVSLKVFDVLGREVRTLVNENLKRGTYELTFNAKGLASGIYLYRLQAGEFVSTKRLLLLK